MRLDFNDKMFAHFKIVEHTGRRPAKSDIPLNVLNRKTTLNDARQNLFSSILNVQKDFLSRRLSVLKRFDIGEKILKEYTARLTEIKSKVAANDPHVVYCQNELLDMVLEEIDYKKDRTFKKAVDECYSFYISNAKSVKLGEVNAASSSSRTKIKETMKN